MPPPPRLKKSKPSCVNALWRDKALDLGSGRHARLLAVAAVRAIFLPGAAFPCSQGAARNSLALIRSTFHARIETGQPDGSNSQLAKYTYRFLCRRLDPWCHLELLRCRELLQIAPMMEIAPIIDGLLVHKMVPKKLKQLKLKKKRERAHCSCSVNLAVTSAKQHAFVQAYEGN